jgi:hypothetical protein
MKILNNINNYLSKITGYKIINQNYRDKFNKFSIFDKIFRQFNKSENFFF